MMSPVDKIGLTLLSIATLSTLDISIFSIWFVVHGGAR